MDREILVDVLVKVAKKLNSLNCNWAIASSMVLNKYGLVDKPNDIDILFDPNKSEAIKEVMNEIGMYIELPSKEPFRTEEFFGYMVDGVMVEFMGGFKIAIENNKIYEFILDDEAIKERITINNININLTTLEDWFVGYSVMNDPKNRVALIKNYFREYGIKNRDLLERNLKNPLPSVVREEVQKLLSSEA